MFCMSEHKILPMVNLPNQDCLFHFLSDDWSIAEVYFYSVLHPSSNIGTIEKEIDFAGI